MSEDVNLEPPGPPRLALLLAVTGLGGLLYGIDLGIIAGALPLLRDTCGFSEGQLGLLVAAVLAGSCGSSLVAGVLADRLGRRPLMLVAGVLFTVSVAGIGLVRGFGPILAGRLGQGLSAGIIGVVVPLYLAETLPAGIRGRGTALFQGLLTAGLLAAALIGLACAGRVDRVEAAAQGLAPAAAATQLLAAKTLAWRTLFWAAVPAGLGFTLGLLGLPESPRWAGALSRRREPLLGRGQWRPLLLVCAVLVANQATGVNSILAYSVDILHRAGLPGAVGNRGDVLLKAVNVLATLGALLLVDRIGRRRLLALGSAGVALCLAAAGILFRWPPAGGPGWLAALALAGFMACFAVGPGVCVWLVLTELLPARIRAPGMALGLLLNQGLAALIAAGFAPAVARIGLGPVFLVWSGCAVGYWILAVGFLPETRGQTLEQIEAGFESAATRGTVRPGRRRPEGSGRH